MENIDAMINKIRTDFDIAIAKLKTAAGFGDDHPAIIDLKETHDKVVEDVRNGAEAAARQDSANVAPAPAAETPAVTDPVQPIEPVDPVTPTATEAEPTPIPAEENEGATGSQAVADPV